MKLNSRLPYGVLMTALILGTLADGLLRADSWGINAAIWCTIFLGGVALLTGNCDVALKRRVAIMIAPGLFFGLCFAWRDSPTLKSLDALGFVTCIFLMAYSGTTARMWIGSVWNYVSHFGRAMGDVFLGSGPLLSQEIKWNRIPRNRWTAALGAGGRGLLLAFPFLLVFAWLFSSADAIFAKQLSDVTQIDFSSSAGHLGISLSAAWCVAGLLRFLLIDQRGVLTGPMVYGDNPFAKLAPENGDSNIDEDELEFYLPPLAHSFGYSSVPPAATKPSQRLGFVEISTALMMIDLLFLSFVLIQARYLFGGASMVASHTGLTFAQYARHGFFELVWAAALALPLLLGAHSLLDHSDKRARNAYGVLAGVLVMLLMVVLLSAWQRMRLYTAEYGMTELRFYTSAFMGLLAVTFACFCVTVLRNRSERFMFGSIFGALVSIVSLHVVNPDGLIVRINVERSLTGKAFDTGHALTLSADAAPALAEASSKLPQDVRSSIRRKLLMHRHLASKDWRTWSLARSHADAAIEKLSVKTARHIDDVSVRKAPR